MVAHMDFTLRCAICREPFQEPADSAVDEYICTACGGSIECDFQIRADTERLKALLNRGGDSVWAYRALLPCAEHMPPVSLGEGNTPLVRAEYLQKALDCGPVYLKNETLNPSGTYKDRFATVAVSLARTRRESAIALGSAGNAAAAVAAYAGKAGIPCFVFLPTGAVRERALQTMAYGARLIRVDGSIDDCIHMAQAGVPLFHWKNLGTSMRFHPQAAEGYKTIAYELGRQLDFQVPDWLICPVGGGSLLSKIYRGYLDMLELGLIDHLPKFAGIQAEGCAPLTEAFRRKEKCPRRWPDPDTIAFAIADVDTFEGATVLHILRETGGLAETVNDGEILAAMRLLASREGLLAEPASATTVAALRKLLAAGVMKRDESAVCLISGSALRDLNLLVAGLPMPPAIAAHDLDAVKEAVAGLSR